MLGDHTLFGDGGGRDPEGRGLVVICYEITKTLQCIPDRDSRVVDEVGFRIPRFGFRDSRDWIPVIPKPWIPDSKGKKMLDSGFRISLHGATCFPNVLALFLTYPHEISFDPKTLQ